MIQKSEDSEHSSTPLVKTLKQLWSFVTPYKKVLIGAGLALILTSVITLSIGQGVKILIDEGFAAGSRAGLVKAVEFLIMLALLMAGGTFIRFYLVSWLGERVSADIRRKVFSHLITLHPSYFELNRSGEIMSRITTDTTLLQSIIGSSFSMALRSFLMMIGAIIMMFLSSVKLSLIVLLGVPMVLLPVLIFGKRVRNLSRRSQDSIADVGTYAGEIIQQIKVVQSFTREQEEQSAFHDEVETAFTIAKRRILQRALLITLVILMIFGGLTGMMWSGGMGVLNNQMTGGDLGAFTFYAFMVGSAFATVSEVYGELQRAAGATERLMELMHEKSEITSPEDAIDVLEQQSPSIHFADVSFSYPSRPEQLALENFSLDIRANESLALVGPSGAGKSTIMELILRFYDPTKGHITFSDIPYTKINLKTLREQVALVPQQPTLFSNDLFYNIRYGKMDATDEQVMEAAKAAHAHEFILSLPDGYKSQVGEQGVRLSGGQRQRIAIARAILKDPAILLLDEATSALDAESERQVQSALKELMEDRTTVVIAHRLATVRHVDRIAVIDGGQLKAIGTHDELMKTSPLYQKLAELQFQS